ncbi:hypothetical protein HEP85_45120 [Streptomyces sp. RPA4-2]|uniref:hypothetical protein n=1 Tax=Streptomyces sp. RPA4-2 TaxID=2721244 RepID=UPI0034E890E8
MTALIATLGSLSALSYGHFWTTGGNQASGTKTAKTADARHDSPTQSAPASTALHRPPGAPSPKAPAAGDRSSNPSMNPSVKAVPAAPPLAWTANSQLWELGCHHDYVIDKAPRQVPPPPAPRTPPHGRVHKARCTAAKHSWASPCRGERTLPSSWKRCGSASWEGPPR